MCQPDAVPLQEPKSVKTHAATQQRKENALESWKTAFPKMVAIYTDLLNNPPPLEKPLTREMLKKYICETFKGYSTKNNGFLDISEIFTIEQFEFLRGKILRAEWLKKSGAPKQ